MKGKKEVCIEIKAIFPWQAKKFARLKLFYVCCWLYGMEKLQAHFIVAHLIAFNVFFCVLRFDFPWLSYKAQTFEKDNF